MARNTGALTASWSRKAQRLQLIAAAVAEGRISAGLYGGREELERRLERCVRRAGGK